MIKNSTCYKMSELVSYDIDSLTIRKSKVFEMDICIWVQFSCRLNESVYKIIIFFSAKAWFLYSQVQIII